MKITDYYNKSWEIVSNTISSLNNSQQQQQQEQLNNRTYEEEQIEMAKKRSLAEYVEEQQSQLDSIFKNKDNNDASGFPSVDNEEDWFQDIKIPLHKHKRLHSQSPVKSPIKSPSKSPSKSPTSSIITKRKRNHSPSTNHTLLPEKSDLSLKGNTRSNTTSNIKSSSSSAIIKQENIISTSSSTIKQEKTISALQHNKNKNTICKNKSSNINTCKENQLKGKKPIYPQQTNLNNNNTNPKIKKEKNTKQTHHMENFAEWLANSDTEDDQDTNINNIIIKKEDKKDVKLPKITLLNDIPTGVKVCGSSHYIKDVNKWLEETDSENEEDDDDIRLFKKEKAESFEIEMKNKIDHHKNKVNPKDIESNDNVDNDNDDNDDNDDDCKSFISDNIIQVSNVIRVDHDDNNNDDILMNKNNHSLYNPKVNWENYSDDDDVNNYISAINSKSTKKVIPKSTQNTSNILQSKKKKIKSKSQSSKKKQQQQQPSSINSHQDSSPSSLNNPYISDDMNSMNNTSRSQRNDKVMKSQNLQLRQLQRTFNNEDTQESDLLDEMLSKEESFSRNMASNHLMTSLLDKDKDHNNNDDGDSDCSFIDLC